MIKQNALYCDPRLGPCIRTQMRITIVRLMWNSNQALASNHIPLMVEETLKHLCFAKVQSNVACALRHTSALLSQQSRHGCSAA